MLFTMPFMLFLLSSPRIPKRQNYYKIYASIMSKLCWKLFFRPKSTIRNAEETLNYDMC